MGWCKSTYKYTHFGFLTPNLITCEQYTAVFLYLLKYFFVINCGAQNKLKVFGLHISSVWEAMILLACTGNPCVSLLFGLHRVLGLRTDTNSFFFTSCLLICLPIRIAWNILSITQYINNTGKGIPITGREDPRRISKQRSTYSHSAY